MRGSAITPKARLMSVDPSLTCTGWALFSLHRQRLLGVGKLKALPPRVGMAERFRDLQRRLAECLDELNLGSHDFLVCEAPTTMRDPRAALLVEQVRALIEALARARGVNVPGRVNPRTVQQEVIGLRGKQLRRDVVKRSALQVVKTLYQKELEGLGFPTETEELRRHQDIVDAILIGNVAIARVHTAIQTGITPAELFESLVRKPVRLRMAS